MQWQIGTRAGPQRTHTLQPTDILIAPRLRPRRDVRETGSSLCALPGTLRAPKQDASGK